MNERIITVVLVIFVLTLSFFSLSQIVQAAPTVTITPQSSATSTNVDYCFSWTTEDLGGDDLEFDPAVDQLVIGFYYDESDSNKRFDISGLTISDTEADTEVYVYFDSLDCGATGTEGVDYTERPMEGWDGGVDNLEDRDVGIGGVQNEFTAFIINIDDDATISPGDEISIGFVNKSGNSVLTPVDAGNYNVIVQQYDDTGDVVQYEWIDGQMLYIGNANEVEISAAVEPSISLTMSGWKDYSGSAGTANTCDLGTLSATNINTCSYKTTIATNASSGYTASIVEDQAMTSGTDTLTAASGSVTADSTTTEAYGVSTTQETQTITQINDADTSSTYTQADCDTLTGQSATNANASGLSTSNQTYASSTGSTPSDEITLCHAITVAGTTPAGLYSHTVTITVVGNF